MPTTLQYVPLTPDRRGQGMSRGLLAGAVVLAARHGATAVEGFPFAADGPHSSSEHQVNDEKIFTEAGFTVVRRPSHNRVVVRKELGVTAR